MTPTEFADLFRQTRDRMCNGLIGLEKAVEDLLVGVLAGGHVLIESPPGLGKTLLAKSLSRVLDLRFSRIQFTPDLMPADILGTHIIIEGTDHQKHFLFQQGPIFTHILMADEINRATPKTQSALLEAMQERQVTISGETHPLEQPFFVIATRNPDELEGTYPLPAAQLDRFLFCLRLPRPELSTLRDIALKTTGLERAPEIPVLGRDTFLEMQGLARQVPVSQQAQDYAIRSILGIHPDSSLCMPRIRRDLRYGPSPRGGQALIMAAKVRSLLEGRDMVEPAHLRAVAQPALRHRLTLTYEALSSGLTPDQLVEIVEESLAE